VGSEITVKDEIAVVPEWTLGNYLVPIGVGIFIEHSEHVEEVHRWTTSVAHSHFSEEDLPSNLIGMYLTKRTRYDGKTLRESLEEVWELCGVMGEQESLDVYENEYQNGAGFKEGWRRWDARLLPITQGCNSCVSPRQWPSQFSTFFNGAVRSERNATWWWWENPYADGVPAETNVEGVFALDEFGPPWPN
jgi:hypothetical protein